MGRYNVKSSQLRFPGRLLEPLALVVNLSVLTSLRGGNERVPSSLHRTSLSHLHGLPPQQPASKCTLPSGIPPEAAHLRCTKAKGGQSGNLIKMRKTLAERIFTPSHN